MNNSMYLQKAQWYNHVHATLHHTTNLSVLEAIQDKQIESVPSDTTKD